MRSKAGSEPASSLAVEARSSAAKPGSTCTAARRFPCRAAGDRAGRAPGRWPRRASEPPASFRGTGRSGLCQSWFNGGPSRSWQRLHAMHDFFIVSFYDLGFLPTALKMRLRIVHSVQSLPAGALRSRPASCSTPRNRPAVCSTLQRPAKPAGALQRPTKPDVSPTLPAGRCPSRSAARRSG